jgi:hypothetical protein
VCPAQTMLSCVPVLFFSVHRFERIIQSRSAITPITNRGALLFV